MPVNSALVASMSFVNTMPSQSASSHFESLFGPPDMVHNVLIAGAGPAGMMLAYCLAKLGVKPIIIDSNLPSDHAKGRGDALQCRTIEVMRSLGVGDAIIAQGAKMYVRSFWVMNGPTPTCTSLNTFFPPELDIEDCYSLGIRQGLVESILGERLKALSGVEVLRPWAFEDAMLDVNNPDGPVTVSLKSEYGEIRQVRARYLVGCDGGKSQVRRLLDTRYGVKLEGNSHDSVWSALDVLGTVTDFPDMRKLAIIQSDHGTVLIIPREPINGKDCVRLYCQLQGNTPHPALKDVITTVHKAFHPFKLSWEDIHWYTIYSVGQRILSSFDVNERIFVAGDAAHLHSPKGGLGMNTSLLDAHNLALKLALVEFGIANRQLLSTYAAERQKVAKQLISMDAELIQLFSEHSKNTGVGKVHLAEFQRQHFAYQAGTSITYEPNLMVASVPQLSSESSRALGCPGLAAGSRILPADVTRYRDGKPTRILDVTMPFDGHFTIFICLGDILAPGRLDLVQQLRTVITRSNGLWHRVISRFAGGNAPQLLACDFHPLIRFACLTTTSHLSLPLASVQSTLFPTHLPNATTTPNSILFDPDTFFCDDIPIVSPYSRSQAIENPTIPNIILDHPLHQKWGVDESSGAIVVVRPDGHVGTTTPGLLPYALVNGVEQGWSVVEQYFERFITV